MSLARSDHDLNPQTFSTDGRLLQLEYADRAARLGSTCIGIKVTGGVVLAGEKRNASPTVQLGWKEKVYQIDKHIGVAYSGVVGDGQRLLDHARKKAQDYMMTYGTKMPIRSVALGVSDEALNFSDPDYRCLLKIDGRRMSRPYGVSMLFGGVDSNGPQLYYLECSGAFSKCRAKATGAATEQVDKMFVAEDHDPGRTLEDAKKRVLSLLKKVMPNAITAANVELATVVPVIEEGRVSGRFSYVDASEVQAMIDDMANDDPMAG